MFLQVQQLRVIESGVFKVLCSMSYLVADTLAVPGLKDQNQLSGV